MTNVSGCVKVADKRSMAFYDFKMFLVKPSKLTDVFMECSKKSHINMKPHIGKDCVQAWINEDDWC